MDKPFYIFKERLLRVTDDADVLTVVGCNGCTHAIVVFELYGRPTPYTGKILSEKVIGKCNCKHKHSRNKRGEFIVLDNENKETD